ncbi:helix-turn-helix domain-containing protein [Chloroflexota bacterium]
MEYIEFGKRLRELRKQAGISQRELADKLNISFTYLSKIESGAMPPPSKSILFKLADALNIDREELLILAGKIPSDIAEMLRDTKILKRLRSSYKKNRKSAVSGKEGVRFMKSLVDFKQVAKVALASLLTIAVATSLWLAAPTPSLKAANFTFSPSAPSGTTGGTTSFTLTIDVTSDDLLPINSVDLVIGDAPFFPETFVDEFQDLPLPSTPNETVPATSISGTSGTISVSSTSGDWWLSGNSGSRQGYGYGYQVSTSSWLGWDTHDFTGTTFGYGYGYGSLVGPTSVTFNITWTAPSNWPTGSYHVTAIIWGDNDVAIGKSTTLTLSSASSSSGGGAATTTPGVTSVSAYVDPDGTFTRDVTAESVDNLVSLTIEEGTTGLTAEGTPIRTISIVEMAADEIPPAPTGGNIIGLTYDFGPDDATFDEPITLTFTYDPDNLPEGVSEEDLVVAVWDDDADPPQWVELPGVVDTVNNTITATVDHFTAFAVIVPPIEEEEVVTPPVEEEEEEVVTPPVEEEEEEVVTPPVEEEEEEEEAITPVAEAGLAWWIWLVIGLGSAVVAGLLVYILWYRPQRSSG